jgi:hypothetical protein
MKRWRRATAKTDSLRAPAFRRRYEEAGAREIDKAWIEALKLLLDVPATNREFIEQTVKETDAETLTH